MQQMLRRKGMMIGLSGRRADGTLVGCRQAGLGYDIDARRGPGFCDDPLIQLLGRRNLSSRLRSWRVFS